MSRVIRVAHVVNGLETGGAELMLERLVHRHDRSRVDPRVVSLTGLGPIGRRLVEGGVRVEALGGRRVLGPSGMLALRRSIVDVDVVQTWLYYADVLGGIAGRLAGKPVVWSIRQTTLDPRIFKRKARVAASVASRLSHRVPTRIVCCSQSVADDHVRAGFAAARMIVIPNGYDFDELAPDPAARAGVRDELGLDGGAVLVGMFARFDPQKDHRSFIAAVGSIARRDARVRAVLAGRGIDGGNAQLREWIDATGVAGSFSLLGERNDIPRLTAALDCAVLASFLEGFPNVVVEALACGVPVVASAVAEAPALVDDPSAVVPPGDPDAMAGAIARVLARSPAERAQRSRADRDRMVANYRIDAITGRYEDLYEELATPRPVTQGGRR